MLFIFSKLFYIELTLNNKRNEFDFGNKRIEINSKS